jgi:hypothetical protein
VPAFHGNFNFNVHSTENFASQSFTSSLTSKPSAAIIAGTASSAGLIGQMKPTAALAQTTFIVNNSTAGVCICVTAGSCALANGGSSGSTDGSGIIDVRIVNVSSHEN